MAIFSWLVASTPLKNVKVNWDEHSQYMEKIKNVPNHHPVSDVVPLNMVIFHCDVGLPEGIPFDYDVPSKWLQLNG